MHATMHVERPGNNFGELLLSFCRMGLKDCTLVFSLGGRCLYPRSHLVSLSHCVCNVFAHCLCFSVSMVVARLGKAVSEY